MKDRKNLILSATPSNKLESGRLHSTETILVSTVVGYFVTCNAPPQLVAYIKISIRFIVQSLRSESYIPTSFIATSM